MSSTHPVPQTTEWDDLQIKYGNYEKPPDIVTNESLSLAAMDMVESVDPLSLKNLKELDELEDKVEYNVLEKYRRERLHELKQMKEKMKYGSLIHLNKKDYIDEVTLHSKKDPDLYILVLLHSLSQDISKQCLYVFKSLATQYKHVKICEAIGTDVIENYPESRMPTLLIYKNGVCSNQHICSNIWGGKGNITLDAVKAILKMDGVCPVEDSLKVYKAKQSKLKDKENKLIDCTNEFGLDESLQSSDDEDSEEDDQYKHQKRYEDETHDGRGYTSLVVEKHLNLF